jgi:hypothetical protein
VCKLQGLANVGCTRRGVEDCANLNKGVDVWLSRKLAASFDMLMYKLLVQCHTVMTCWSLFACKVVMKFDV